MLPIERDDLVGMVLDASEMADEVYTFRMGIRGFSLH